MALLFPGGLTAERFAQEWATAPLVEQLTSLRFSSFPLDRPALDCLLDWPGLARLSRGVFHWDGRSIGYLDDERLFQTLRARLSSGAAAAPAGGGR